MSANVDEYLTELWGVMDASSSASKESGTMVHVAPRDVVVSMENTCRNALDDEMTGLLSRLFDVSSGLPQILVETIERNLAIG